MTKLDLVNANYGAQLLSNKTYPLELGYVGVSKDNSIFNNEAYQNTFTSTDVLKSLLVKTLTNKTRSTLKDVHLKVKKLIQDTRYKFKVEFNDERMSREGYMSQMSDDLKSNVKNFFESYAKPEMNAMSWRASWKRF